MNKRSIKKTICPVCGNQTKIGRLENKYRYCNNCIFGIKKYEIEWLSEFWKLQWILKSELRQNSNTRIEKFK